MREICTSGSMSGEWKRSMAGLVRHRQPKGPETDRPRLNHRATPRLYFPAAALGWTHRQRRRFFWRREDPTRLHSMLAGPVTLERWAIATAVLTAFREMCELRPIHISIFPAGQLGCLRVIRVRPTVEAKPWDTSGKDARTNRTRAP
jgi:hypothetical protein